jgi:hypothetical protein
MRIPARWTWFPLALTVAGVVYLSMVKLTNIQAAMKEPAIVRELPRPFVPPPVPAKRTAQALQPPPEPAAQVVPLAQPVLPGLQLPPFHSKPAHED